MERKPLITENEDWLDDNSGSGPVLLVFLMLAIMAGTLAAAVFLPKCWAANPKLIGIFRAVAPWLLSYYCGFP
jgi:hypothetical protein